MAVRRMEAPTGAARLTSALILLAAGSGAVDAFSFAGLGAVFASVMTGNLVLLGVALVHARIGPVLAAAAAIVAYVLGVFGAASWLRRTRPRLRPGRQRPGRGPAHWAGRLRIPRGPFRRKGSGQTGSRTLPARSSQARPARARPARADAGRAGSGRIRRGVVAATRGPRTSRRGLVRRRGSGGRAEYRAASGRARRERGGESGRLRQALTAVPAAQVAVLVIWLASGGHPAKATQLVLLALSAFAMGVQSAGVNTLPLAGAATTYLTGTLTTLTTELATSGSRATMRRRFAVLVAALVGAGLNALVLTWARPVAPVLPLATTLTVLLMLGREETGRRP